METLSRSRLCTLAAVWILASASPAVAGYIAIDLNPSGFDSSAAYGISGGQQVGSGLMNLFIVEHAMLWSGTAASAVDLNPSGFTGSTAKGVSGTHQVGYGIEGANPTHALLWSGTAASFIDLNPSGFTASFAWGVSGGQQVGWGFDGSEDHALLWSGTAASAIDLNPSGFTDSFAYGISGGQQVGYGDASGTTHALLWSGTAASAVDLNVYLPAGFTDATAFGIDSNGDIVGVAYGPASQSGDAFLWHLESTSVPEPCSLMLVAAAGLAGLLAARRRAPTDQRFSQCEFGAACSRAAFASLRGQL